MLIEIRNEKVSQEFLGVTYLIIKKSFNMKIKITIAKKRFLFNYARIVNMLSSSRTMMKIVENQFA